MAGLSDTVPLDSFESTSTVNSRAPLTSASFDRDDSNFVGTHDYETPFALQKELEKERAKLDGHRKKQCLIYEPASVVHVERKLSDEDSDGVRYVHAHDKLYRTMFIILFILLIISLGLSAMVLLGVRVREQSCGCGTESSSRALPKTEYSRSAGNSVITAAVENNVMQIQRNFTYLYSVVIPSLQARIEELKKKAELKVDISKMVGPRGPPGPPGPSGPSGVGNLSQCTHQSRSISTRYSTREQHRIVATTDKIVQPKDKIFTGVSCSSKGAAEYNLIFRETIDGLDSYFCRCGGESSTAAFISTDRKMYCYIHWWECPTLS